MTIQGGSSTKYGREHHGLLSVTAQGAL